MKTRDKRLSRKIRSFRRMGNPFDCLLSDFDALSCALYLAGPARDTGIVVDDDGFLPIKAG